MYFSFWVCSSKLFPAITFEVVEETKVRVHVNVLYFFFHDENWIKSDWWMDRWIDFIYLCLSAHYLLSNMKLVSRCLLCIVSWFVMLWCCIYTLQNAIPSTAYSLWCAAFSGSSNSSGEERQETCLLIHHQDVSRLSRVHTGIQWSQIWTFF